jgi:hypothetical protein
MGFPYSPKAILPGEAIPTEYNIFVGVDVFGVCVTNCVDIWIGFDQRDDTKRTALFEFERL